MFAGPLSDQIPRFAFHEKVRGRRGDDKWVVFVSQGTDAYARTRKNR
jgi:hypothetical protein